MVLSQRLFSWSPGGSVEEEKTRGKETSKNIIVVPQMKVESDIRIHKTI